MTVPLDPFVAEVTAGPEWEGLNWSAQRHSGNVRIGYLSGDTAGPDDEDSLDWSVVGERFDVVYGPLACEPVSRAVVGVDDPATSAHELAEHVSRNPQASTVLAAVLRAGSRATVREALDIESWAYSTLLGGEEFAAWLTARGPRPLPPTPPASPVLVERHGDRVVVTLNRPERRNAFGAAVRDALVAALEVCVLDDSITAVELRGAGPVFCAGGDLDEFGTTPDPVTAHFVRTAGGAGARLAEIAGRTTAFLHGTCVGAGIELPALAGRVVVDPATTFRLPEVGMGLIPGAGGTVGIPRRIGRWRAFHLAVTGVGIGAPTALRWGLADDVADVAVADVAGLAGQ
ncbi:enoyl-CoA hydratase/isomerase family protein [Gordonia sp. PKS22-38]|uniref:Enoyl-CoA hydratase/isomerase family protein n=1 Tax=Gordonia prachuapensis TaxID=3115651 RepID=A0ABU7N0V0_9ACTN|nr:enoyl-CoA hydratase/isomerase family protein [Gordonia sp. PKS22-38]